MATSKKAVQRYKQKAYDQIQVRVKKGDREKIQEYAASHGESVNSFITSIIYREISGFEKEGE